MTGNVKKIGMANLKTMIESDKLLIHDVDIITELSTFVQKRNSYEAEEGYNDDLVMCLVIFAWLAVQDYFKDMTDYDVRQRIYEDQKNQSEQDMAPFGFITTGLEGDDGFVSDGTVWYGDTQEDVGYMWNY